jgi:hypothetical protein
VAYEGDSTKILFSQTPTGVGYTGEPGLTCVSYTGESRPPSVAYTSESLINLQDLPMLLKEEFL